MDMGQVARPQPQPWNSMCRNDDCDRKGDCRRYTMFLLAEAKGSKPPRVFLLRETQVVCARTGCNFISNDSTEYETMPLQFKTGGQRWT